VLGTVGLLLAACAKFPQPSAAGFQDNPPLGAGPEPTPQLPGEPAPPGPSGGAAAPAATSAAPSGPCVDPDPAVVATCLGTTGGVAVLPDGASALVAERRTGRLLQVAPGTAPVVVDTVAVEGSTDGGLLDVALSPTWLEDRLLYLYVTTPTDNRVVRLSPGDSPKPVLTGIPRGPSGNAGSLAFDATGDLLVATGAAGSTTASKDPASLAGKLLRVDLTGAAPADNPTPGSPVLAAGIDAPGGVCTDATTGTSWVTDRTATTDRLRTVVPGRGLGPEVWTWPDRPGVGGCAALGGRVAVALGTGSALYVLTTSPENAVIGDPEVLAKDSYGRLAGADVGPDGLVWVGTTNADGGTPVATDDRAVRIQPSGGAGGGSPA
jgi:glucose/arabinose dehydrogenase